MVVDFNWEWLRIATRMTNKKGGAEVYPSKNVRISVSSSKGDEFFFGPNKNYDVCVLLAE